MQIARLPRVAVLRLAITLAVTACASAWAQQEELGDINEQEARAETPTPPEAGPPPPAPARPPVSPRFELKRALSNRGAIDENSRTTLRAELLLASPVSLIRLELPFVDKNNSFTSDPLNAGVGDLKTRVAFAPLPLPRVPLAFFLEAVFPTAKGSLGYGKYVVAPAATASIRLASWSRSVLLFIPLVEQYVSIAGDPDRAPVDYTYFELALEARWPAFRLNLNPKPTIDWTSGVRSAAVLELQATWLASVHWRLWIKLGQRLWGETLPGTYDQQLEIGVRWTP